MHSQSNILNYVARSRNYLIHTGENTSMLISKIFLYDAGVIFIFSRVEPSVCIIFCACCHELNNKPSRKMFFQRQTNVAQCRAYICLSPGTLQ